MVNSRALASAVQKTADFGGVRRLDQPKPQQLMKRFLVWMFCSLTTISALAQGKVSLVNDSLHLVYFTTNTAFLNPGDAGLAGTLPTNGTAYADLQTVLAVDLYSGTSSSALSLISATTISPSQPGKFGPSTVVVGVAAPSSQFYQVQIHDSRDASEAASAAANHYFGHSIIFICSSGSITPRSIVSTNFSTWTAGTFDVSSDYWGPGSEGAIELRANGSQPNITNQPVSLTVTQPLSAIFSVAAQGALPLSYQWQKDGANLIDVANVAGSTTDTLLLTSTSLNDAGNYTVVITNSVGNTTSSVAILTVLAAPAITVQPQSQTVFAGTNVTLFVGVAAFPPPTYQWTRNGTNLAGATNASLVYTNVQFSQLGDYAVAVTNALGYATSAVATLTVLSGPQILSQPASQVGYWGLGVTFQPTIQGTGPIYYQWYFDGTPISSGTNATLLLSDLELTAGGQYWLVITNAYGSLTSSVANLLVNPAGVSLHLRPSLTITGAVGKSFGIQYSSDPSLSNSWITLTNLSLTEPSEMWFDKDVDISAGDHPIRFYRVVAIP